MTLLYFKDFTNKYQLKIDTMSESDLQRVYNYPILPEDSRKNSNRGMAKIDNGQMGGTPWPSFIVKDNKSFYLDSFGGQPDKFSLQQSPKPIIYHNIKIHDICSKLCGSFCFYFFYSVERMNDYDTLLKTIFG